MQYEIVKSQATTESLYLVTAAVFGKKETKSASSGDVQKIGGTNALLDFVKKVNGS